MLVLIIGFDYYKNKCKLKDIKILKIISIVNKIL